MRKLIALCVSAAFAGLLCQAAICQERQRPAGAGTGDRPALTEGQRTQLREMMQTLRKLQEKVREAEQKARKDPAVVKAYEAVRKAQEAANKALDEAIVKANPDLKKAVQQRKALRDKMQKLGGGRSMRGGTPRGGRTRSGGSRSTS
jgi:ribonuclease HII